MGKSQIHHILLLSVVAAALSQDMETESTGHFDSFGSFAGLRDLGPLEGLSQFGSELEGETHSSNFERRSDSGFDGFAQLETVPTAAKRYPQSTAARPQLANTGRYYPVSAAQSYTAAVPYTQASGQRFNGRPAAYNHLGLAGAPQENSPVYAAAQKAYQDYFRNNGLAPPAAPLKTYQVHQQPESYSSGAPYKSPQSYGGYTSAVTAPQKAYLANAAGATGPKSYQSARLGPSQPHHSYGVTHPQPTKYSPSSQRYSEPSGPKQSSAFQSEDTADFQKQIGGGFDDFGGHGFNFGSDDGF